MRRTRDRKSGAGGNRGYGGSPRTRYAAKRRSGVKITRIVPRQTCNRYSVIESQPQSHLRSHPRSRLPLSNPLIILAQAHDHEPSTGQGKGSGVKPGATRRKTVVFLGSLPAGFFLARKGESLPARSPGGTCRRRPAAPGRGRRRSHGRKHRAHRSLGNRAQPSSSPSSRSERVDRVPEPSARTRFTRNSPRQIARGISPESAEGRAPASGRWPDGYGRP